MIGYNEPKYEGCCDMPVSPPKDVPDACESLRSTLGRTDHLVNLLADKLCAVVRQQPPETGCNPKMPERQTALGKHIQGMQEQLRDITDNLESIINRIEL